MTQTQVIIDSDPATGVPNRDVDDGLAFLVLLGTPELHVQGITINFGNVGADVGFQVAENLLDLVHATVPLYKGAQSKADLGKSNPAVDFMIETVRSQPGEISLLALGPLTNVATAMLLDPGFADNLKELVIMGGSFHFQPFSFFGEFNFHLDGRAASITLSAPCKKTLISMDVCSQAVFRKEQLRLLESHASPVSRYLAQAIRPWLELNRKVFIRAQGFFPWDVVAAAYIIDPTLFDENYCSLSVRETGLRSGSFHAVRRLDQGDDGKRAINAPLKLDSERFMAMFMAGLLKF